MKKKIQIIPAILPRDWDDLEDKISLVGSFVKQVQIDICDGQFVPNATWPFRKHDLNFEMIIKEERGMPQWENLDYEYDLMVNWKDKEDVRNWIQIGASRLVFHAESKGELKEAIDMAYGAVELGMAIDVETDNSVLDQYKDKISFIQCMGIDKVGFQGQKFDTKVYEKVKDLKKTYPDLPISIDGGVKLENATKLVEAGAERLVIGSAIFSEGEVLDNIQSFQRAFS